MSSLLTFDVFQIIWDFLDSTTKRFVKISSKVFSSLETYSNVINFNDFPENISDEMIEWLILQKFPYQLWLMQKILVSSKSMYLTTKAFDNGFKLSTLICDRIITYDNLDLLKLMTDRGYRVTTRNLQIAVIYDSIYCLQYIVNHGCIITNSILRIAIDSKSKRCIEYILSLELPKDSVIIEQAVRTGDLDLVKKLELMGYEISDVLIDIATEEGHMNCFEYFIQRGLKCTHYTSILAATYGNIECLEVLYNIDPKLLHKSISLLCLNYEHYNCFEFLCHIGFKCDIELVLNTARIMYNSRPLKYLLQRNCPVNINVYYTARNSQYTNDIINLIVHRLLQSELPY